MTEPQMCWMEWAGNKDGNNPSLWNASVPAANRLPDSNLIWNRRVVPLDRERLKATRPVRKPRQASFVKKIRPCIPL
ncbi:MAG: hypothetical protein N2C14_18750 [Planctomycetales bacterium]